MAYQYNTILKAEFEQLRLDLIAAYDAKGMRASGKFADELETEVSQLSAVLRGPKHTEQLEYGRRPGPISYEGMDNIKEWIIQKNVFNAAIEEIGLSSLAFLIARKIRNFGWKREGFGGVDLVSEVVTPERIQKIIDKVGRVAVSDFVSDLNLKAWQ